MRSVCPQEALAGWAGRLGVGRAPRFPVRCLPSPAPTGLRLDEHESWLAHHGPRGARDGGAAPEPLRRPRRAGRVAQGERCRYARMHRSYRARRARQAQSAAARGQPRRPGANAPRATGAERSHTADRALRQWPPSPKVTARWIYPRRFGVDSLEQLGTASSYFRAGTLLRWRGGAQQARRCARGAALLAAARGCLRHRCDHVGPPNSRSAGCGAPPRPRSELCTNEPQLEAAAAAARRRGRRARPEFGLTQRWAAPRPSCGFAR